MTWPAGWTKQSNDQLIHNVFVLCGYVLAYVTLDWVSFAYPYPKLDITPWSPQAAVSVVLLLLRGPRWIPAVCLGAFIDDLVVRHLDNPLPAQIFTELSIGLVYGLGVWAMRRFLGVRPELPQFSDIVGLACGTALTALVMAVLYVGTYWWSGVIPGETVGLKIFEYWLGDLVGVLVFAPPLLLNFPNGPGGRQVAPPPRGQLEAQAVCIGVTLWLVFFHPIVDGSRVFYLIFVPMMWVAATGGLVLAATTLAVIQSTIIVGVWLLGRRMGVMIHLQMLMLTLAVTSLFLAALVGEREKAQKAALKDRDRLRAIVEMSPDGMLVVDQAGMVVAANSAFAALAGSPAQAITGSLAERFVAVPPTAGETETVLRRSDGQAVDVAVAIAPMAAVNEEDAVHPSLVLTFRDITTRKQAEGRRSLQRANLEAATRNALTEEIAAGLAHELNQPLSAVVGYTGACRKLLEGVPEVPAKVLDYLDRAALQAERAGAIISRLREFFRNGKMEVETVAVDELVEDVLGLVAEELSRHEVAVTTAVPKGLRARIDRLQIEQVLINLLRNSLQAMDAVPPKERHLRLAAADGPEMLRLSITDSGGGIASDVADSLFIPFVSTHSGGMGLGLSISRGIVESHGGQLWTEPATERGATFHLTLPILQGSDHHAR